MTNQSAASSQGSCSLCVMQRLCQAQVSPNFCGPISRVCAEQHGLAINADSGPLVWQLQLWLAGGASLPHLEELQSLQPVRPCRQPSSNAAGREKKGRQSAHHIALRSALRKL